MNLVNSMKDSIKGNSTANMKEVKAYVRFLVKSGHEQGEAISKASIKYGLTSAQASELKLV